MGERKLTKALEALKEATEGREAACRNVNNHTTCPTGYVQWHAWAKKMALAHKQKRCPGCGLFTIWVSRRSALEASK